MISLRKLIPVSVLIVALSFSTGISGESTGDNTSVVGRVGRCLSTMWNWISGTGATMLRDQVISGNPDDIRYFLYPDPKNKSLYEEIIFNDTDSLHASSYRFGQPWKILIHGYTMSKDGKFPQNVKNAYLDEYGRRVSRDKKSEVFNVLAVDWAPLADPKINSENSVGFLLFYTFAVQNVQVVGKRVGEFIGFLKDNAAVSSLDKVHLVGFSLGAHVAGNAANTVKKTTGTKVGRLTGLDPAGPNFYMGLEQISSPKLSKSDADFVDVYHSNQGAFGTLNVLGDCDFYPNGGGPTQQYCKDHFNSTMAQGSCAHNMAPVYFAQSISNDKDPITGCGCSNYHSFKTDCDCKDEAIFGEYCLYGTRGTFYLDMNDTAIVF